MFFVQLRIAPQNPKTPLTNFRNLKYDYIYISKSANGLISHH